MQQPDTMPCPLCSRVLTSADQTRDGRFHCPICAPTSKEAQHGWLSRPRVATAPKVKPVGPAQPYADDPMFAKNRAGEPITRERTCECGKPFTQRQLSAHFCEIVEKVGGMNAVMRQIPDLFVPVHCPPCERRDLGRQATLDTVRDDRRTRDRREPELSFAAD